MQRIFQRGNAQELIYCWLFLLLVETDVPIFAFNMTNYSQYTKKVVLGKI